jgi:hypothetical protein
MARVMVLHEIFSVIVLSILLCCVFSRMNEKHYIYSHIVC